MTVLRFCFDGLDLIFDRVFTPALNPLKQLGTLGLACFAVVVVSGVHLYIGFDTSVSGAYDSVEYLSHSWWFLAGVERSLHRYASDAMVLFAGLHILREFAHDRYRGPRWFSWFTGVPALVMLFAAGIGGYWLVWDELAQYIAITTTEWFDRLPIFAEPIARNFVAPDALDDRFFTLLIFLHIAVPLFLSIFLWLHLQRIARPGIIPPRRTIVGLSVLLVGLSVAWPAVSQAPADLGRITGRLGFDWFYLPYYPLMQQLPGWLSWGGGALLLTLFAVLPWLPPDRSVAVAVVDPAFCNGCGRCHDDCPYTAITMAPRRDDKPFDSIAVVNPSLCVGCGICVGACPPSTPFRRTPDLPTGIDLPRPSLKDLRAAMLAAADAHAVKQTGVMVFACAHGAGGAADLGSTVKLPCLGMLPPSFIDYALSRGLAEGVLLAGCDDADCRHRLGQRWTEARLARTRDPRLRGRIDRDLVAAVWAGPLRQAEFAATLQGLRARIAARRGRPEAT